MRNKRESLGLPLRKVAAELDIDTSILSKIERNERSAIKNMMPILAKSLEVEEISIEIEFIKSFIVDNLGDLNNLRKGLTKTLEILK